MPAIVYVDGRNHLYFSPNKVLKKAMCGLGRAELSRCLVLIPLLGYMGQLHLVVPYISH